MKESKDSDKGNICLCTLYPPNKFEKNLIKHNILDSGNFGVSITGENVEVSFNNFLNSRSAISAVRCCANNESNNSDIWLLIVFQFIYTPKNNNYSVNTKIKRVL